MIIDFPDSFVVDGRTFLVQEPSANAQMLGQAGMLFYTILDALHANMVANTLVWDTNTFNSLMVDVYRLDPASGFSLPAEGNITLWPSNNSRTVQTSIDAMSYYLEE